MEPTLSDGAEALFAVATFRSFASGRRDGLITTSLLAELEEAEPKFIDELVSAGRLEEVPGGGYQIVNVLLVQRVACTFDGWSQ